MLELLPFMTGPQLKTGSRQVVVLAGDADAEAAGEVASAGDVPAAIVLEALDPPPQAASASATTAAAAVRNPILSWQRPFGV